MLKKGLDADILMLINIYMTKDLKIGGNGWAIHPFMCNINSIY